MTVGVSFYSYFKDLTGTEHLALQVDAETTVGQLFDRLIQQFPRLQPMRKSTLIAVGVDYQHPEYVLRESDEVSFFPPVQGG